MSAHIEIHQLESSQETHEQHVPGELLFHSTIYPDIYVQSRIHQHPPLAYKTTVDPATLYLHQAMKQQD